MNPQDQTTEPPADTGARPNLKDDVAHRGYDRAGAGGVKEDSPGDPGGTLGTDGTERDWDK